MSRLLERFTAENLAKGKKSLRWLMGKTKPYLSRILFVFGLDTLVTLIGTATTLINKRLIDDATGAGGAFEATWYIALIGLTLCSILIGALSNAAASYLHERYSFSVRSDLYKRVLDSDWKAISAFHSGDINTRLTSDVDAVSTGIASLIPSICYLLLRVGIAFAVLFYFDRVLALAALGLAPVGLLLSLLFTKQLKTYQTQLRENEAAYRGLMQESVQHITVFKAFQREEYALERLNDARDERLRMIRRKNRVTVALRAALNTFFQSGYLVALGWGLTRLAKGEITYGTLSVFFALVSQIQNPVAMFSSMIPQLISVLSSADRIRELENLGKEEQTKPGAVRAPVGVRFERVTFSYAEGAVLKNASFDLCPGEIVGLVGDSGIGKTTIARLMLALLVPSEGNVVFYDNRGASERASAASRRFISYVPQGNTLISGTLRENLQMSGTSADDETLWRTLELSDADFARKLPDGLDTKIAEHASSLSEGQAQRVAIARAILRGAPLMILDEATSALDLKAEQRIIENLRGATRGMTCLVITHRRSLLTLCDRCLEINASGSVQDMNAKETARGQRDA